MKDRLLTFLKTENKSSAQFAEEIGVQPSSISHIISGRNNPSLDFVVKMLNKYPSLSTDWLIFGKGNMYRDTELNNLFDVQSAENEDHPTEIPDNNNEKTGSYKEKAVSANSVNLNTVVPAQGINRTKRIICFFEDQTFREYFPGD